MGAEIMFIYAVVGISVSMLYCLLTGWSDGAFITGILMSPILLVFWVIAAGMTDFIYPSEGRLKVNWHAIAGKDCDQKPGSRIIFWFVTLFCLLPILVRALSILVGVLGYEELSAMLYERRYLSMAYCLVLVGAVIVIATARGILADIGRQLKRPAVRHWHDT